MFAQLLLYLFIAFLVGGSCIIWYLIWKVKKDTDGCQYCTYIHQGGFREDVLSEIDGNEIIRRKPNGIIQRYYTSTSKSWNTLYPPGRPRILQVSIGSTLYANNNPEPLDPFGQEPIVTSELLGNVMDAKFSEVMVDQTRKMAQEEIGVESEVRVQKTVYIALGVVFLVALIACFLSYMSYAGIGDVQETLEDLEAAPIDPFNVNIEGGQ